MKTIQTKSGKLIVVDVPDDATCPKIVFDDSVKYYSKDSSLADGNARLACYKRIGSGNDKYKILGVLSELSEEQCGRIIGTPLCKYEVSKGFKIIWIPVPNFDYKWTAQQSLISFLQSNKVNASKNLLLIEVL